MLDCVSDSECKPYKLVANGEADLRSTREKIHIDRDNMRREISVQDLLDHVAEHLDLDERF